MNPVFQHSLAAVFLLAGLGFFGYGAWAGIATVRFLLRAIRLDGELVGFVENGEPDGQSRKFSFMDPAGRIRTEVCTVAYKPRGAAIGQRVAVLYDPSTGSARLMDWTEIGFGPVTSTLLGAGLICAGTVGLRWSCT